MKQWSFFKVFLTIVLSALGISTLLITFSPGEEYIDQFQSIETENDSEKPTPQANGPKKLIGIVPGHYGFNAGYQCGPDFNFVQENNVNLRLAVIVRDLLRQKGYTVDLFQEFDAGLSNYTGLALVSIHMNSCSNENKNLSGFTVTTGGQNTYPTESKRLNECLAYYYNRDTEMQYLGENRNMDDEMLYTFDTVNNYTTISVIHAGFLDNDYRMISENTERLAKGIADGIICYVENEKINMNNKPEAIETVEPIKQEKEYYISLSKSETSKDLKGD